MLKNNNNIQNISINTFISINQKESQLDNKELEQSDNQYQENLAYLINNYKNIIHQYKNTFFINLLFVINIILSMIILINYAYISEEFKGYNIFIILIMKFILSLIITIIFNIFFIIFLIVINMYIRNEIYISNNQKDTDIMVQLFKNHKTSISNIIITYSIYLLIILINILYIYIIYKLFNIDKKLENIIKTEIFNFELRHIIGILFTILFILMILAFLYIRAKKLTYNQNILNKEDSIIINKNGVYTFINKNIYKIIN